MRGLGLGWVWPILLRPLTGVAASSPSSAFAVGVTGTVISPQTLMLRWNGNRWTPLATGNPGFSNVLGGVDTTSPHDAWAAGTAGGEVDGNQAFSPCTAADTAGWGHGRGTGVRGRVPPGQLLLTVADRGTANRGPGQASPTGKLTSPASRTRAATGTGGRPPAATAGRAGRTWSARFHSAYGPRSGPGTDAPRRRT